MCSVHEDEMIKKEVFVRFRVVNEYEVLEVFREGRY